MVVAALSAAAAETGDVLILGRDVSIREFPRVTAAVVKTTRPGETYEVIGRKPSAGRPLYILDERGNLWLKVKASEGTVGFLRTDNVSVAREEFRSPRGNPLLIVNLRPTADGEVVRELWLVQESWSRVRRIGIIDGQPIWDSGGEWFLSQVDSERPIKDPNVDRTIECIQRFAADGRGQTLLAAGTYPILLESRGEVYFYRDLDEHGAAVPQGLFAVNVDGSNLHPVFLLPERFRFWKEDGDFFVEAPGPILHGSAGRIVFFAYDRGGPKVRFTVTLDGQLLKIRTE
jgi:hypothetical protein